MESTSDFFKEKYDIWVCPYQYHDSPILHQIYSIIFPTLKPTYISSNVIRTCMSIKVAKDPTSKLT
jgi:hypothetical protein